MEASFLEHKKGCKAVSTALQPFRTAYYTITKVENLLGVYALSKTDITALLTNPQNDFLNQKPRCHQ